MNKSHVEGAAVAILIIMAGLYIYFLNMKINAVINFIDNAHKQALGQAPQISHKPPEMKE
jgi:hypothetical protein